MSLIALAFIMHKCLVRNIFDCDVFLEKNLCVCDVSKVMVLCFVDVEHGHIVYFNAF